MNGNGHIWRNELNQLRILRRIHRGHYQRQHRARVCGTTQAHEHKIDPLVLVPTGDLPQTIYYESVKLA